MINLLHIVRADQSLQKVLVSASFPGSGNAQCQEVVPIPNSPQISSLFQQDWGTLDPGCPKTSSSCFSTLHGPLCHARKNTVLNGQFVISSQKTAPPALRDLYWSGFFPPVDYIIFFSMIFLTILLGQWTWVFTTIIRYSECTNECCSSKGISFLIWRQAWPDIVNKGLGTETKV